MPESSSLIVLDGTSAVPPFEQIRAQVADQIADGFLPPGTRLPTVRRLAGELGLAVNTVARAYRELETAGLVTTRGRAGTVVSTTAEQSRGELEAAARSFAEQASALGVGKDEALRLISAALGLRTSGSTRIG